MVTGGVRWILRSEGAVLLVALCFGYAALHGSWWIFIAALFLPDVAMAGYLGGTRLGAMCYNVAHSYVVPVVLAIVALRYPMLWIPAIIWGAHIAFDRALGYGLKYSDAFTHTHLGTIGKTREADR
jgi:hypothetical protein